MREWPQLIVVEKLYLVESWRELVVRMLTEPVVADKTVAACSQLIQPRASLSAPAPFCAHPCSPASPTPCADLHRGGQGSSPDCGGLKTLVVRVDTVRPEDDLAE